MKQYCNTTFYNRTLPFLLVLVLLSLAVWTVCTGSAWPPILMLLVCVYYKRTHIVLEAKSLELRRDYGLFDRNGQAYPRDLTDASERDLVRIRESMSI